MIRPFTALCFVAFAGAGAWLYGVKHTVSLKDRELAEIRRQTETARQRIDILRAEWALLNEPERLRQTASRVLSLEAMQPQHFARMTEFERRLPAAAAFAGVPDLFAPPPGAAPVMLAAAPAAAAVARAAQPGTAQPGAAQPAATPAARVPEAPAPQALAAAVAAQRAEQANRAAQPGSQPAAPSVARPAQPATPPAQIASAPGRTGALPPPQPTSPRPIQPAVFTPAPPAAEPVTRVARNEPPAAPVAGNASALGGSSLGRPMLAPPVPIGSAQAATLDGLRPPTPR